MADPEPEKDVAWTWASRKTDAFRDVLLQCPRCHRPLVLEPNGPVKVLEDGVTDRAFACLYGCGFKGKVRLPDWHGFGEFAA